MKLRDLKGLFRSSKHKLICSENPFGDYWVFDFAAKDIDWRPGEHGIYTLPDFEVQGKKWRAFSVASHPTEGFMRIGTKIGNKPSSFKTKMRDMKTGDEIKIRGPFGWFLLQDETSPIVMIAGGIGITPYRALFKKLAKGNKREATLIYSSNDGYLFQDELDSIAAADGNINIEYVSSREETRDKIDDRAQKYENNAFYYISGAPPMIESAIDSLKEKGIDRKRIITDPFKGY